MSFLKIVPYNLNAEYNSQQCRDNWNILNEIVHCAASIHHEKEIGLQQHYLIGILNIDIRTFFLTREYQIREIHELCTMGTVRLTKIFNFEMAHALLNYEGKCKNIHGHSYTLEVTIIGSPKSSQGDPEDGLLIDFGTLKKLVNSTIIQKVDHSLMLNELHDKELLEHLHHSFRKILKVSYQPTCENMLLDFANKLKHSLPQQALLHHLRLEETHSSYAEWYASDNA